MVLLVVLMIFLYVVLTLLLSAWTVWFSGYLYESPTQKIEWRGPAAGGAVLVVVLLWVVLAYRDPGRYRSLWEFTSTETTKPFRELVVTDEKGKAERYRLIAGTRRYHLNGNENLKRVPSRPPSITVTEDGQKSVFRPEMKDGKLMVHKTQTLFSSQDEPLRYVDEKGRVMLETSLGQLTTFRGGYFVLNLVLNLLMFAAWFLALWLLLAFQWPHALGQAAVFWLVMMMFVMPPVLSYAEGVAEQRAKAAASS